MKFCKRCAMPDTRPGSVFDEEGVCGACRNYDKRSTIDWKKREEELKKLCDKYRRDDGYYDCVIPVSGGKDSHYQVYIMKEKMGMNPLLLTVGNPFTETEAGKHNFKNIGTAFGCDHILFNMSSTMLKKVIKVTFEEYGNPLMLVESACLIFTYTTATKLGIPFIIFGENPEYEYGTTDTESSSANQYLSKGRNEGVFKSIDFDFWQQHGVSKKELSAFLPPTEEEMERTKTNFIFMSYFYPWSSTGHLEIARRYGFRDLTHEWKREGCIEDFEQIDSIGYVFNFWLKYPKFGFQRTSDIASRRVREGKISLSEAKKLIMEHDHKLDQRALDDFISFLGYTPKQFWDITEKFWNRDIFEKVDEIWHLKDTVSIGLIER